MADYDQSYCPDALNLRFSGVTWQTRLGCALSSVIPGSGNARYLDNLYKSDGTRIRLAAQGNGASAVLYEWVEGVNTGWVTASGGGGLGGTSQNLFQAVTLGDRQYLSDRANALFKYTNTPLNAGNHLQAVTQPAAPAVAPAATPRPLARLEDWTSPSWIDSDATKFADSDDSSTTPPPDYGKTRKLAVLNTGAAGQSITYPSTVPSLLSHTIALYLSQSAFKLQVALQFGIGSATDFQQTFSDPNQNTNTWYPVFIPVGDIALLNYLRFTCIAVSPGGSGNVWVSALYLPGRLEGPYRYCFTYYDPVSKRESAPSPISNGGQALDFSAVGVSFQNSTTRAFSKCCALRFTASGDASVTQIRIYRSGGVPELTVDDNGTDLWLRVATVNQFSTTFNANDAANLGLLHLTATTGINSGDWIVLDPGVVGKEEYVQVTGKTSNTVNITNGGGTLLRSQYAHAIGAVVSVGYVDNTPNEQIQLTQTLDVERNDPPAGARFVARSPEGRLWLFNWTGSPTGIAVSNKPTPDRPFDYEVFPNGVDPITRRSLTQGFRVQYTGDVSADEEITWGGFYRGHPMFFTRQALYIIRHQSQVDWSATSIQRVHKHGCIAGDTVIEQEGVLYWVADGPRVMAWDGSGEPQSLSDRTVNLRLNAAPVSSWQNWFAMAHTKVDGPYVCLYFTPAGASGNTQRLDYNIRRGAWEPVVYNDSNGNAIAYQAAAVRGGAVDTPDLYAADSTGKIDQCETGSLDRGSPIQIKLLTNRVPLKRIHPYFTAWTESSYLHTVLLYLAGVAADTVTTTLTVGGGEYGITSFSYVTNLAGASTDMELPIRADRSLKGRWFSIQISGSVSNRPAFRTMLARYILDRLTRVTS